MHLADGWLLMVTVVLFKLVVRSVAVGWQLWMALVFGGVLFKLELVVVSLMSIIRLCKLELWLDAVWCWLWVSVMLVGMWVVGVG